MLTLIRQLYSIVGSIAPGRLALLIGLFALSSAADSVGIVLVFALFKIIIEPEAVAASSMLGWAQSVTGLSGNGFLLFVGVSLIGLFVLKALIQVAALMVRWRAEMRLRAEVARQLFGYYLHAPYPLHLTRSASELSRNVHGFAGGAVATALAVCDLIGDLMLLAGIAGTLVAVQPAMALGAMVVFGGIGGLYLWITRRFFQRLGEASNVANQQMYRAVAEPLDGVKQIKTIGGEHFFTENYVAAVRAYVKVGGKSVAMQQGLKPIFEVILMVGLVAPIVIALLAGLPVAGVVPTLAMFGAAAYRLMPSLLRATSVLQQVRFSGPSIEIVHTDIQAWRRQPIPGPAETQRVPFAHRLELDSIGFRYDEVSRPALHGISLAIERGQAIGIVGSSGAGKTTLVDVMLGLLAPTAGQILLDGKPLPPRPHPNLFGYVPQDGFVVNDTVRRNVALGVEERRIDARRLEQAIDAASLAGVVAELPEGLDTIVGDHGLRLSGGQRQRLTIARALYRESEILILDEATSALDPVTEAEIAGAVEQLRGKKTLIIIAHRLSTVKNCDRIVLLDAGRIADSGSFAELLTRNDSFREMVGKLDVGLSTTLADPEQVRPMAK